jgi:hypothetical protein
LNNITDDQDERVERLIHLAETIIKGCRESNEGHQEEHRWIRAEMLAAEAKASFWMSVANKVVSGGVWAIMVGMFSAVVFTLHSFFSVKI